MEIHYMPVQEAHLCQIAQQKGKTPEELIADAILCRFNEDDAFRQAVQRGVDQADAERFIDKDVMEARLKQMMRGETRIHVCSRNTPYQ